MLLKPKTLIFLFNPKLNQVALSTKKYGYAKGKPNGYGGKVEHGEAIEQAALRELYEEAKIKANVQDLNLVGKLLFEFPSLQEDVLAYIYVLTKWQGIPKETKEMSLPKWYNVNTLPLNKMWPSDKYWVPKLFKYAPEFNIFLFGRLVFNPDFEIDFYDVKVHEK